MNADEERAFGRLMVTVRRLAASSDKQISYLEQLSSAPNADELALEFDDYYQPMKWILARSDIPAGIPDALQRLDELLLSFAGLSNADLWTTRALVESPVWEDVRRAARHVIDEAAAGLSTEDD